MRMLRTAGAASAAVLSILSVVGPADGAQAAVGPVDLEAVTVVSATASGYADVRLPRPVVMTRSASFTSPAISVTGSGRIVGIVLRRIQSPDAPPATVLGLSMGNCASRGCRPQAPFTRADFVSIDGPTGTPPGASQQQFRLPAGVYRLFVIADGGRVDVTLRFRELSGSRRLHVTAASQVTLAAVDSDLPAPPSAQAAFSGGMTASFPTGSGLMMFMQDYVRSPHVAHEAGSCLYSAGDPPGGVNLPGCPQADGAVNFVSSYPTPTGAGGFYGYELLGGYVGKLYQGFYDYGVQGVGWSHLTMLALPLPE